MLSGLGKKTIRGDKATFGLRWQDVLNLKK